MQYRKIRYPRKTHLLLLVIILLQTIQFSGCLSSLDDRPAHPTDNAPVSSLNQQNQRPFQAEMDVPGYLDGSFRFDEAALPNGISGARSPDTPAISGVSLNSGMAVLKNDFSRLCLA
jgi:hypothetical protein